jgi:hypothetical protein
VRLAVFDMPEGEEEKSTYIVLRSSHVPWSLPYKARH